MIIILILKNEQTLRRINHGKNSKSALVGQFGGWRTLLLHITSDLFLLVQKAWCVQGSTLVCDLTNGSSCYHVTVLPDLLIPALKGY